MTTDPADLGAIEARQLIARRKLSPVELTDACIARTEAINPAINAVVATDFDRMRAEARKAEEAVMAGGPLGPVHGLPFGVKDMIDVTGLPTTLGSEIYRDNIATKDDAIVAAMRQAGAVVLGKTNNPEFSAGGNTVNTVYGPTGNPHDPTKSAAGSSGGSAAALATGMAPLCTGSDTGGSLRNPAAFCGVVGFRPSPGVVPGDTRGMALMHLPTSGPMARTVADTALMLSIIARPDRLDTFTAVIDGKTLWNPADFARLPRRDLSSLKFAFTEDYGFAMTEKVVRRAFSSRMDWLAPTLGRAEATTPDCTDADRIFAVLRALMFLGNHHPGYAKMPERYGPNIIANVEEGLSYSALDVADVMNRQGAYYRRWLSFFDSHDYLLSPAVTISPRDWHELYPKEIDGVATQSYYQWLAMAYASTIAGHPSITIPVGRDELGMPFGLQIVGRRNDDLGVLAVAAELEAVFAGSSEFARPLPDIEALKKARPILADGIAAIT
ncbi:amidase [Rhizobium sp. NRK18]|uniref:amidase n=1 Tax=Rhizobium sp. NRK18 TaxID=2964667 RepID=UPI0021C44D73|nr:amidase family protein [Rhizobium sp. NRK18]MCQ2002881.1 amidase family protein [Rhizobium sp. NRK18]